MESFKKLVLNAVFTVIATALVAAAVQAITSGGLIEILGGVTKTEFVQRYEGFRLHVQSQVRERDTQPVPAVPCPEEFSDAFSTTFHESYFADQKWMEKHFRVCVATD